MGIKIDKEKKTRKFQQVIWLDTDTYMWILGLAKQIEEAPNVVISKLLNSLYEYVEKGVFNPIHVVEREKLVKGYRCPYCNKVFDGSSEFIEHLVEHRDMLKQLFEGE